MWKCKKCGKISEGSNYATNGYCKVCKEIHLLERYDPLNKTIGGKTEND